MAASSWGRVASLGSHHVCFSSGRVVGLDGGLEAVDVQLLAVELGVLRGHRDGGRGVGARNSRSGGTAGGILARTARPLLWQHSSQCARRCMRRAAGPRLQPLVPCAATRPPTSLRQLTTMAMPSCLLVWKQFLACASSTPRTTPQMPDTTRGSVWAGESISSSR